jgi:guanidinopropionase
VAKAATTGGQKAARSADRGDLITPADPRVAPRHAQIATLLRAPLRSDASGIGVALVGIPWDAGSPNRSGSRHAPAQMREMSRLLRPYNFATRISPFEQCGVADLGDAPVNPFDTMGMLESVKTFLAGVIDDGACPVAAGGDNTITLPVLRAVGRREPVGVIHFDAHGDTMDLLLGQRYHNGSPFRRAIEDGVVDPKRVISIGLRGTLFSPDLTSYNDAHGMTVITIDDYYRMGAEKVIALAREVVGPGPVHISFDIDALDPAYAPGTGGPEPGGLSTRDCQVMIRGFNGLQVIGADISEVSPPLDPSGITAVAACNLMFEIVCVMGQSVTDRRKLGGRLRS